MTEPTDQPPDIDPLVREAIAKVIRLTSGEATVADADEIKRWRGQSPEHEQAFRQAVALWKGMGAAAARSQTAGMHSVRRVVGANSLLARRAFIGGGVTAAAAAVALYAVAYPPLNLWPSWSEFLADYRTGKGEQREVVLGPHVTVQLSTMTSLAVESKAGQHRLELISGEAAITANDLPGQPLVLVADDGRVIASDASFNARCLNGVVSVTCLAGTVQVESQGQAARLGLGQQVSYSASGLGKVTQVNVDSTTSWRSGMLVFENKPLSDVIDEVNRYRPGRIIITNGELAKRVVNGTFRRDQIDTFIAQIRQLFGVSTTALPGGLLLLS